MTDHSSTRLSLSLSQIRPITRDWRHAFRFFTSSRLPDTDLHCPFFSHIQMPCMGNPCLCNCTAAIPLHSMGRIRMHKSVKSSQKRPPDDSPMRTHCFELRTATGSLPVIIARIVSLFSTPSAAETRGDTTLSHARNNKQAWQAN